MLGSDHSAALYQATRKSYQKMVKIADKLLKPFCVPRSIDDMKICREDLTMDFHMKSDDAVLRYIRILQKSCILPHYERMQFCEEEGKAKDVKEANQSSYRQACKTGGFTAYDKVAQLKMIGRLPNALCNQHILRLEVMLKRETLKKHLGKQSDNYYYLKEGAGHVRKVIRWYLKRLFKNNTEDHVKYECAVEMIQNTRWKAKNKERLLYLLRKVSDSQSLDAALRKTKDKFNLSSGQMNRLLQKLNVLKIHPITLPNREKIDVLHSLIELV